MGVPLCDPIDISLIVQLFSTLPASERTLTTGAASTIPEHQLPTGTRLQPPPERSKRAGLVCWRRLAGGIGSTQQQWPLRMLNNADGVDGSS